MNNQIKALARKVFNVGIDGLSVVVVGQAPVASVIVVLAASSLLVQQSTVATAQLKDANGAIVLMEESSDGGR